MSVQQRISLWLVLLLSIGFTGFSGAINILGIVTSESRSHNHYAAAIFNELASSGHSVTVLSPYSQSPKINHYALEMKKPRTDEKHANTWSNVNKESLTEMLYNYLSGVQRAKAVSQGPHFKHLLESDIIVDVIIFDLDYNEALLGLGEFFRCPIILLASDELKGLSSRMIGLPYPLRNLKYFQNNLANNFLDFLYDYLLAIFEEILIDFYYYKEQASLYEGIFNKTTKNFNDVLQSSNMKAFISGLSNEPALSPDIIDVTGVHIPATNFFKFALPKRLDEFINSAEDGFIYISLGADVNPLNLPRNKINAIFRVLYRRPERIIWSWNGNVSALGSSDDIYIDKWLPQNDILRHPSIKLFITSGGRLSLIEAIHHEVPIIGIPLSREQFKLLDTIQEEGLGVKLELDNVTESSLSWAINEVLENDRYRENLIMKSEHMQDRPITPIKTFKFWLNYAYRHRHENRSNWKKRLSFVRFYILDFYLIVLILLVTSIILLIFLTKLMHLIALKILAKNKVKSYKIL